MRQFEGDDDKPRLARPSAVQRHQLASYFATDAIRTALTYYQPLVGRPGCELRLHSVGVYASLFRFDDALLANPHIWGAPASANPVLQLRRIEGSRWFDSYRRGFDAVWETALPIAESDAGTQSIAG